ncbi:hypothetical protein [Rhizobium sp. C4]|uniref:hypothetical protein n=1 Tax=Rhizobium sp. C4 TaxID=1349800 RepID=UPI001E5D3EDA|nr:hypothetical protein [Rhizobium sp. C4]MCD2173249.1 hypothetical protein [Rhizobium sp. C4]
MADFQDHWWVIGSAAILLSGASGIEPNDIAVLLSAEAAQALALRFGAAPLSLSAHPKFRSKVFFRQRLLVREAEFMGGFEVAGEGGWQVFWPTSRRLVHLSRGVIPVPAVADLKDMCRLFGRAKDMEKLARLEALG